MSKSKEKLANSRERLARLFAGVSDQSIREIISDVVALERKNRSSRNFPVQQVRDIVDREARFLEK